MIKDLELLTAIMYVNEIDQHYSIGSETSQNCARYRVAYKHAQDFIKASMINYYIYGEDLNSGHGVKPDIQEGDRVYSPEYFSNGTVIDKFERTGGNTFFVKLDDGDHCVTIESNLLCEENLDG